MLTPKYITVPVDQLRKNLWNTNAVSPSNEEKIRNSIKRNGLFKPIIVRTVEGIDGFEIIGGEHRWEQAVELGFTEIPIVDLGTIDEKAAKEIGIIDNARYGADDAVSLGDLLKEIGDFEEIQTFLPYGESDLNLLFSASDFDLDSLNDDLEHSSAPEPEEVESVKPTKTHQVMRFKVSIADAERITALISSTRRLHGYSEADDLTNAGDALVHLLAPSFTSAAPSVSAEDAEYGDELNILDEIIAGENA